MTSTPNRQVREESGLLFEGTVRPDPGPEEGREVGSADRSRTGRFGDGRRPGPPQQDHAEYDSQNHKGGEG
jgi:hypothetical protein